MGKKACPVRKVTYVSPVSPDDKRNKELNALLANLMILKEKDKASYAAYLFEEFAQQMAAMSARKEEINHAKVPSVMISNREELVNAMMFDVKERVKVLALPEEKGDEEEQKQENIQLPKELVAFLKEHFPDTLIESRQEAVAFTACIEAVKITMKDAIEQAASLPEGEREQAMIASEKMAVIHATAMHSKIDMGTIIKLIQLKRTEALQGKSDMIYSAMEQGGDVHFRRDVELSMKASILAQIDQGLLRNPAASEFMEHNRRMK